MMLPVLRRLLSDQRGATSIEYTLIAILISVAAIAAFQLVGQNVMTMLGPAASALK